MNYKVNHRRGVVLLLVLSMLVLFLMMGATLLVIATRARTTSRAFLAAGTDSDVSPVIPRMMLDEALLLLIRGSSDPATQLILTESLLGDMYGTDRNRVPFRDGRNDPANPDVPSPPHFEPYDAFDDRNPFLSKINDDGVVERAAFQPAGGPPAGFQVDNDGDGIADGLWFSALAAPGSKLLPDVVAPSGSRQSFRVSYLVLDLDGRINVNAHGGGGGAAPVGPASIDPANFKALKDSGLTFIQTQAPALTQGPSSRHHAIIPKNFRQSPVLAPSGLSRPIPGRGGDPYSLRLDLNAQREADVTGTVVGTNPFTLGELERVLRPFDSDWATLPPRLASMVTDLDGAARRTLTTESWDTTFTTGVAAPAPGEQPRPKFDLTSTGLTKSEFANELFHAIRDVAKDTNGNIVPGTEQWCANVAEYRAFSAGDPPPDDPPPTMTVNGQTVSGVTPHVLPGETDKWGTGLEGPADLLAIPMGTKQEIQQRLDAEPPLPVFSLIAGDPNVPPADRNPCPGIFEAVGAASKFTVTTQNDVQLNLIVNSANARQNVAVREPGRVNVNTCSDAVWDAVCGGSGPARTPAVPMESLWDVVKDVVPADHDVRSVNRSLANRRALIATVRSNVFAIWITLEVTDNGLDAGAPTCHRLFAIVDRSIPVNYRRGVNAVTGPDGAGVVKATDVRDTIRLKRYLN